jgi:hypothetical protein
MRCIAAISASVLILTGCAAGNAVPPAPKMDTVNGSMAILDTTSFISTGGDTTVTSGPCMTLPPFDDIQPGATVVISDDAGKTLTITTLGNGAFDQDGYCLFPFTATVPAGRGFYGVAVAQRGTVKEPEAHLRDVRLILGQ